jgi:hypothetical protein
LLSRKQMPAAVSQWARDIGAGAGTAEPELAAVLQRRERQRIERAAMNAGTRNLERLRSADPVLRTIRNDINVFIFVWQKETRGKASFISD